MRNEVSSPYYIFYSYEGFPQDWADAQTNLGATYVKRIKGDQAENLEKAIIHCQSALQVHTHNVCNR